MASATNRPLKMRSLAPPEPHSTNSVAAAHAASSAWATTRVAARRASFTYRSKSISALAPRSRIASGSAGRWSMKRSQVMSVLRHRDVLQQLIHRGMHHLGERPRVDAHEQHRGGEQAEHRELARV